jgi:DNA-binding HxlR family transcriptional regulator
VNSRLPLASEPYTHGVSDPRADRTERCSVALSRAFEILGKRWNGVILGALSIGPAGFAELSRAIGGISDSMLSDRLSELVAVGVVSREVAAGPPVTVAYALTDSGRALDPILADLEGWVRNFLPGPDAAAVPDRTPAAR